jgi:dipeptidyl aminopeptidase/acylaminoacyl peptidase
MKTATRIFWAAWCLGWNLLLAQGVKQYPLKDFFRNPAASGYQISPDGTRLLFCAPEKSRLNLFVQKIGDPKPLRLTAFTDRDPIDFYWKGNDVVLYEMDNAGDENTQIYAVSASGGTPRNLTPFQNVVATIIDDLEDHPTDVLVSLNKRNPEIFDLYRLNVKTGEIRSEVENPGYHDQWLADNTGAVRLAVGGTGATRSIYYRDKPGQDFREVLTVHYREAFLPLFFSFDNRYVYAASNIGRDKSAIVKFDPVLGKEVETIFEHESVDVETLWRSKKRQQLLAVEYDFETRQIEILDKEFEREWAELKQALPPGAGAEIHLDWNKDETKWVVLTTSDRDPGRYWLYDVHTNKVVALAAVQPWLNPDDMAEMRPIRFQARDGMILYGYLTLPPGRPSKHLPLVVNPHGGPWWRDRWGFNPEVQFLANRGYAVLQVNFRGSTGYGRKYTEAGYKQWGQKMQDDLTDGVHWAIGQGYADPKRIAIYGASYGGYAALCGLAFTPELYACGVSYVGISNLFTWLEDVPSYWKPFEFQFNEMVGHPVKDKEMLAAASPIFHIEKIQAPLLVIHGANDPRVKQKEADQIVQALKARGVEVEYLLKTNEGHGFSNEENRLEAYMVMEKFLSKHLGVPMGEKE